MKLKGLDLFSGIGGISLALQPWVKTVAYCECEPYAQAVLLERMQSNDLDSAPIWDDVRTLNRTVLDTKIDIIFGGFPCQDISVAGKQLGVKSGTRSGLFFELMRLVQEFQPKYIFLENVAAICANGLDTVLREVAQAGYDAQWSCVSAAEVGAPHKRDRWWLLAYASGEPNESVCGSMGKTPEQRREQERRNGLDGRSSDVGDANSSGCLQQWGSSSIPEKQPPFECGSHRFPAGRGQPQFDWEPPRVVANAKHTRRQSTTPTRSVDQSIPNSEERANSASEPERVDSPRLSPAESEQSRDVSEGISSQSRMGRDLDGIPYRTHRIKALGNSVVPQAARQAFKKLMGGI